MAHYGARRTLVGGIPACHAKSRTEAARSNRFATAGKLCTWLDPIAKRLVRMHLVPPLFVTVRDISMETRHPGLTCGGVNAGPSPCSTSNSLAMPPC